MSKFEDAVLQKLEAINNDMNEFNSGIVEASRVHEKLTQKLESFGADGNAQMLMSDEKALKDLVNGLGSCEEIINGMDERLRGYDELLNKIEQNVVELISKDSSSEDNEHRGLGHLHNALKDFTRFVTEIGPEHMDLLRQPKFGDKLSIEVTTDALRRACNFLDTRTPNSQLSIYKEKTQQVRDVLNRFMELLYSHVSSLIDKLKETTAMDNTRMLSRHIYFHRHLRDFGEIIRLVKEHNLVVYQRILDVYLKNAVAIFDKDVPTFLKSMRHCIKEMPDESAQELDEIAHRLKQVMSESNMAVEAEQDFLSTCMHVPSIDKASFSPELSSQMCEVLKSVFGQMSQGFHDLFVVCAARNHLVASSLYTCLISSHGGYADPMSYFSVLFAGFLEDMKRIFEAQMDELAEVYKAHKPSKKCRVGVLPVIDDFEQLSPIFNQINKKGQSDIDKWVVKLCNVLVDTIENVASKQNPKYPQSLARVVNFRRLSVILSEMSTVEIQRSTKNRVKQTYLMNKSFYVVDRLGQPLKKLHVFFESIEDVVQKGGVQAEKVVVGKKKFSEKTLKRIIEKYPPVKIQKKLKKLYRKVEKDTGDDVKLLQLVWSEMQVEFINQIADYQASIERYYPDNKNVVLKFSVDDINNLFLSLSQRKPKRKLFNWI